MTICFMSLANKIKINHLQLISAFTILIFISGCAKTDHASLYPEVKTHPVSNITENTAVCGGDVSTERGTISSRGVCWSTGPNPSVYEGRTEEGPGSGSFKSKLTLFLPGTTYYVRAYADNGHYVGYGSTIKFRTKGNPADTVVDLDGNVYHTVTIGSQTWMVENLKTTKYWNGDPIAFVPDGVQWCNLTSGAYCNVLGDQSISCTYGRMYNGYAVSDARKPAPEGWHIPTILEWETLFNYLGGTSIAGAKLKDSTLIYWKYPNTGATNEAHFFALPSGGRNAASEGRYDEQFLVAHYWSSTDTSSCKWVIRMHYQSTSIGKQYLHSKNGFCIRCIKD